MTEVVVTGVGVIAPGVEDAARLPDTLLAGEVVEPHRTLRVGALDCRFTRPTLDPSDPHLPTGRETRILRRDVALAVVCVGRLLEGLGIGEDVLKEAALFVSTGLCQDDTLEAQIEEMCGSYISEYGEGNEADRNHAFFRMLPPLMALAGLSNASACFIAREYRVRGPNAVFGVTSHSGHAALREAFHTVRSGRADLAVVGGANAAGTLSALTLTPLAGEGETLSEAEAAAFLLVESRASAEASGREPLARIASVGAYTAVPDPRAARVSVGGEPGPQGESGPRVEAGEPVEEGNHAAIRGGGVPAPAGADVVFGGSVFERDARAMRAGLEPNAERLHGWFPAMGSAGAASVALDVGTASQLVAAGSAERVLCVNRDVYGRESWVVLEPAA